MGLGEASADADQVLAMGAEAVGLSAYDLGVIRMRITQRFYWSKNPLVAAAIEMACIDLQGKAPVFQPLDREKVDRYHALYASGRYANLYVEGTSGHRTDPYRPTWLPLMPAW